MAEGEVALELHDIQAGVLRPRPTPYAATYILLRIDEQKTGRHMLGRLAAVVSSAADPGGAAGTSISAAISYAGMKALGLPQSSLDSFAWEFRQGMVARAPALADTGESSPEHWEKPLGSSDMHVVVVVTAPDQAKLEAALDRARPALEEMPGVMPIWRQDCHALPDEKEPFGFRDGISHPGVEGSGIPGSNPLEEPLKAGEFVLGYRDEMGALPPMPVPEALGRNGTYIVFRKLHQRVAEFRRFVRANAANASEEEWIAAKMMGRWRSGAPLALCPLHDDPELGADATRNNAFLFAADDPVGYGTPRGSHCRRMNPRDTKVAGVVRLHRMIRRGTAYGPLLPAGVLEDDGEDRGLMFAFVGSHLKRQFEFVQSEWINDGVFLGLDTAIDPVTGAIDGEGSFSIAKKPIPKKLRGLSRFVVTRGGEYCFMPGLSGLRWIADLDN
jgi:Dyp-type peroxidase family